VIAEKLVTSQKNGNTHGIAEDLVLVGQISLDLGPYLWDGLWDPVMSNFVMVHADNALPCEHGKDILAWIW